MEDKNVDIELPCCNNCEHSQYTYIGEKITYCHFHKCEVMIDGICREYKKAEEV